MCVFSAALLSLAAYAQQKADGKVTYEDGDPVLCATVALLEHADSSVVAGTVTALCKRLHKAVYVKPEVM